MNPKAAKTVAQILALALLIPSATWAQGSATLSGSITGPSGAAVPNARIVVKNLATSGAAEAQADARGLYTVPNLAPGDYEVSVSADGFAAATAKVTLAAGGNTTANLALIVSSAPSLGDLGIGPEEAKGSAQDQARLDKRSHMLKWHQRLGLITIAPLAATLLTSSGAAGRKGTSSGRDLHAALGGVTAGLYLTTASFAIFAPKVPGTPVRGSIRLHKALAWIHGPGMILTPILGAIAYNQRNSGQKIHGIAQAHAPVAIITGAAYGLAILSVSVKF
jgi:hypothetical protein